jgi:hypothetical protein
MLREESRKAGVPKAKFSHWTKRKYGTLVIKRVRKDGQPGTSLPCVVCRKVLDRLKLSWMAHIDEKWIRSTDPCVPVSKPTNKQRGVWEKQKFTS